MRKSTLAYCLVFFTLPLFAQRKIVVAADGSGDHSTVQAAFNNISRGNKKPVIIYVRSGVYKEKLHLDSGKNFVVLIGEDKFNTVITYDDHTGKLSPSGEVINTRTSWSFMIMADDFKAMNITFQNTAGFTAGQAVAVEVRGDRAFFENCRFIGNQDVLFTSSDNSRQYYKHCYVEGTTDFIFGSSTAWFEQCHIHSKKNSHITAASTPESNQFGYVFNDCMFTADTAFVRVSLGRPWRPHASVSYINCYLDRHILPAGWDNWKNAENEKTARFSEYNSYGPGANAGARFPWTRQLTDAEVKAYTMKNVLRGWNPELK